MKPRSILFLGLLALATAQAQTVSRLSGTVTDASNDRPIPGATVEIGLRDTTLVLWTDSSGQYLGSEIPTGIVQVRISAPAHVTAQFPEVWVRLGRTEVLDAALEPNGPTLQGVNVPGVVVRPLQVLGSHSLTVEQSLRYPAAFFDPVRVAATVPGVATTNDQANHLSIRGNGPASNAWLLEGAEIVTPNHLTNAGTASDLPTLNGGGTNILSAQMLGNSQLLTGGMAPEWGNALGGILDMRLRRGLNDRQAYTLQAGLLGIDLSTEGPFKAGGQASYLVNYRYSTVGLLSAMGIDLGEEVITFQDLSFHLSIPLRARGSIALFGLGGNSSNRFHARPDTAEREFDKDARDITYTARMGAVGATLRLPLGDRTVWRTTVALSQNEQDRAEVLFSDADSVLNSSRADLLERKLSVHSAVGGQLPGKVHYRIGTNLMERTVERGPVDPETTTGWLLRPFAQLTYHPCARLMVQGGAALAHWSLDRSSVPEPRLAVQWAMRSERSITIAAGQRSQLAPVQLYRRGEAGATVDNRGIGPGRMQEVSMAYHHPFRDRLTLHVEVFHQRLQDVPVGDISTNTSYDDGNLSNAWDRPLLMALSPNGSAERSGLELSLMRSFFHGLFYQVSATWINATTTDIQGVRQESRWNNSMLANVMLGREFRKATEQGQRTWGVSGRVNAMGGLRATPVDLEASRAAGSTRYVVSAPLSEQLPTFSRIDVRVYLKRERKGRTGLWALDLQNVANTRNVAFRYFDTRQDAVVTKYQLGLIPNLSYRVEF